MVLTHFVFFLSERARISPENLFDFRMKEIQKVTIGQRKGRQTRFGNITRKTIIFSYLEG
ncbi:MAG: hypothetical protein D6714_21365 [Bacteroidetes bacterium]|nr:MAG: hypothetical protein D6714_21365 [Bacteroidota bacterium]